MTGTNVENPLLGSKRRARAHGKVNMHLGVGNLRDDGFHELVTVFQSISLANEVTLTVEDPQSISASGSVNADSSGASSAGAHPDHAVIDLRGPRAAHTAEARWSHRGGVSEHVVGVSASGMNARAVPVDSSNLVVKAVERYLDACRHVNDARGRAVIVPPVSLHITKNVPTAGGMAGGSADCAATLMLIDDLHRDSYSLAFGHPRPADAAPALMELAADLGSDVPFALLGGTRIGTGRGEQLVPVLSRGPYWLACAFIDEGLSTPVVFRKLDELRAANRVAPPALALETITSALCSRNPNLLARAIHNDLQPAAISLMPKLRSIIEAGREAGALEGMVSGSGPTVFFVCPSEEDAHSVAENISLSGLVSYTCVASTIGSGVQRLAL